MATKKDFVENTETLRNMGFVYHVLADDLVERFETIRAARANQQRLLTFHNEAWLRIEEVRADQKLTGLGKDNKLKGLATQLFGDLEKLLTGMTSGFVSLWSDLRILRSKKAGYFVELMKIDGFADALNNSKVQDVLVKKGAGTVELAMCLDKAVKAGREGTMRALLTAPVELELCPEKDLERHREAWFNAAEPDVAVELEALDESVHDR